MLRYAFLFLLLLCFVTGSSSQTSAPGGPGKDAQWATAGKQAVGTSASLESKVWFTLAQGVMTEVYYPDVTVANVHLLQFIVVNKKTKKVETERDDTVQSLISEEQYLGGRPLTAMQIADLRSAGMNIPVSRQKEVPANPSNSLHFIQQNVSRSGKWSIKKRYITDPALNTVLIRVFFQSSDNNLELYVYYDPSLGNSGMHDTAWSANDALLSQDKDKCSALIVGEGRSAEKMSAASNGFFQVNDGLDQLVSTGKLDVRFDRAENGNVAQIGKISSTHKRSAIFTLALGFGSTPDDALNAARMSLRNGFDETHNRFVKGWNDYTNFSVVVEPKYQTQFNMAAMQLKALEDKTNRGANIASLTVPWGGGENANENSVGGYHLVWSRDLYQVFTAYMALGDKAAANRALDFLFKVQQRPDGSFPQNSWLDGKPYWTSLQMDEVAYPLIMAWQLERFDKQTYTNHVKKTADFIVKNGPSTPQERWEEEAGYSPSTIAAEIAGLVCAADIAKRNGDTTSAELYLRTADEWESNIEKWTATKTGKYGDGNYYVRITQHGKPDAGEKIEINNGAGFFDEREIIDAGFLELVRLGIRRADDPLIVKSVKVVDQVIKVDTPNGPAFYRYNHDGYGEMDDGRRWNWDGKYTGKGRLWALLSGERGQYEIAHCQVQPRSLSLPYRPACLDGAGLRLDNMAAFANEGLMIPEQIWDKKESPKNIDRQFVPELSFGEGTGSATPLAWSMAQFIRLAVNLKAGKNLDTPSIVYQRYVLGKR